MRTIVWTALAAAVLGLWLLGAYNRLTRLRGVVLAAFGGVESLLRQRQALARALARQLSPALADAAPWSDEDDLLQASATSAEGREVPPPAAAAAAAGLVVSPTAALELLERAQAARVALECLPRRAALQATGLRLLSGEETALSVALDRTGEGLTAAALEAPLAPPVAEGWRRLRMLQGALEAAGGEHQRAVRAYHEALAVFPTSLAATLLAFRPAPSCPSWPAAADRPVARSDRDHDPS